MADKPKKQYRTFIGFVKFEPTENEVERDDETITVRSIVVRGAGVKEQAIDVRATLWPSHDHIEVEQGDLVAIEGPFTVKKGKNKDDEPVTWFNLSVTRIVNLGAGDAGVRDDDEDKPARKRPADTGEDAGDEPW